MLKRSKCTLSSLLLALCCGLLISPASAAISPPAGAIPAGMPARMLVGLFEQTGSTWMQNSGVPWDVRYSYFVKGWADNWGWGERDGGWGLGFMRDSDANRFIPAVQYYQMNGEPGGGENAFYAKTQNAGTMASYFADFKLLLQRAKEFGKPVIVMIEADGFGFLEQQTGHNPSAYAAIAASGVPELSGLPNTVAGWGLAFLQLRKALGANNVVLGIHISAWASGKDIAGYNVTEPLSPEVDRVYNFLAPFGVSANVTGATYDFLVGDPLDRDPDFYKLTQGRDAWWDASDAASINARSFNRYAEWLRLWNVKSGKRWLLWQIPLGNSNHLNVYNNGAARQGYKGNFPEYFFASTSRAHLEKYASAGVFGLLFGAGTGGQSSYENDVFTDGKRFMQSRAGDFLKAGGLAIPAGSSSTPPPPPPPPPGGGDNAVYNFESGTQGWAGSGAPVTGVSRSTTQTFAGTGSLAINISGSGSPSVAVASPVARAGQLVTYRVYLPTNHRISWVQPYVLQGAVGGWAWTGNWQSASGLRAGAWNTLTVQVPANAAQLYSLGVQLGTNGSYTGTLFVDAVTF
ncbi:MAG TPA: hypothetical protein VFZ61_31985 [Polyangiales bacterium]